MKGSVSVYTGVLGCGKEQAADDVPGAVTADCTSLSRYIDLYRHMRSLSPDPGTPLLIIEPQGIRNWQSALMRLGNEGTRVRAVCSVRQDLPPMAEEVRCYTRPYAGIRSADIGWYLRYGGTPILSPEDPEDRTLRLLESSYDSAVLRCVSPYVPDIRTVSAMVSFLLRSAGTPLTRSQMAKGTGLDPRSSSRCLQALVDAGLFIPLEVRDLVSGRTMSTKLCLHPCDPGLPLASRCGEDVSASLRSAVLLELLRRGYGVAAGCYRGQVLDFIASHGGTELSVQCVPGDGPELGILRRHHVGQGIAVHPGRPPRKGVGGVRCVSLDRFLRP